MSVIEEISRGIDEMMSQGPHIFPPPTLWAVGDVIDEIYGNDPRFGASWNPDREIGWASPMYFMHNGLRLEVLLSDRNKLPMCGFSLRDPED